MRFEARELKDYAVSVEEADLKVGKTYFLVWFFDEAMLIPELNAMVYLGYGISEDDPDRYIFQDAGSYMAGQGYEEFLDDDSSDEDIKDDDGVAIEAELQALSKSELGGVYEFEEALNVLLRCSVRRTELKVT
jgi:hypothetical protein